MKLLGFIAAAMAVSGLAACGSGGGGARFKSFSTLEPGQTYRLSGDAVAVEYDTDPDTGEVTAGNPVESPATVEFTLDDVGALLAASITLADESDFPGPPPDVEFNFGGGDLLADGDTVDPLAADHGVAMTAAGDQAALIADPEAMGFEYQTFGIWATGLDTGTGVAGAGSFGRATTESSLPVSGEATYLGQATGLYLDPDGMAFAAFAAFEADFDFGDRSFTAFTSGTAVIDAVTGVSTLMPSLNFAGAGTVSVSGPFGGPADGTFEADIGAIGLNGTLNGRLYGPNGEEIGGVFNMSGLSGQYIGAIGAAQ